jgi:hypothetical protein
MPNSHLSVRTTLTDPFVGRCGVPDAISTDSAAENEPSSKLGIPPRFSLERAPFPKVRTEISARLVFALANGASQLANCLAKTYLVRKHQWRERRFVTTSTQPGNQLSASSTS